MDLFGCIKSNPYPIKNRNFIGYGCIPNRKIKYNKVDRRKCGRYIRKYGFDITETWSLDYSIAAWLSDNVGGFFRKCGSVDDWSDYDLEGNKLVFDTKNLKKYLESPVNYKPFWEANEARKNEYLKQLDVFLKTSDKQILDKFITFVTPRLLYLAEHAWGYPGEFESFKTWQECIRKMANDFIIKRYSEDFIKHFYGLWT